MPTTLCTCGEPRARATIDNLTLDSICCPSCMILAGRTLGPLLIEDMAEPMRSFFLNRRVDPSTA